MKFVRNDGGRAAAGYEGSADDCVCRAISIAAEMPYDEIYQRLADGNARTRITKRTNPNKAGIRSARNSIYTKRKWFHDFMTELGFKWHPTMAIGSGCQVHLADGELPMGRLVVSVSQHMCAVIDGVLHDTHDCTRGSTRCVYGYYVLVN